MPTDKRHSVLTEKWSAPLIEAGFTCLPQVLFDYQAQLGLDPVDFNILAQLASFWWQPTNKPRPGKTIIAARIGRCPRTVQRRIQKLEASGKIQSVKRRGYANLYLFDGLITQAKQFALDMIEDQRKRRKRPRKKSQPNLALVANTGTNI
jgi:hypothetical protein